MPGSSPAFKLDIRHYLLNKFPQSASILDIGAGQGTYHELIGDYFPNIDALEVYAPYVDKFKLFSKYRHVFVKDCRQHYYSFYNIIIAGDLIEHLNVSDAQTLLESVYPMCDELVVAVPYLTVQGAVGGIEWEVHQQPDLTHEIMMDRYGAWLKRLFWDDKIGIYVKRTNDANNYVT